MARKIDTKAEKIYLEVNGLQVPGWRKVCPTCGKTYETTTRHQKFCSNECAKTYTKKKAKARRDYVESQGINRLASRAHAVGVEVLAQLERLNIIEHKCTCGATENLQCHHKSINYLDNSPSNLIWLCPKCHAAEHARIEKQLKEEGKTLEDLYPADVLPLYKETHKRL